MKRTAQNNFLLVFFSFELKDVKKVQKFVEKIMLEADKLNWHSFKQKSKLTYSILNLLKLDRRLSSKDISKFLLQKSEMKKNNYFFATQHTH